MIIDITFVFALIASLSSRSSAVYRVYSIKIAHEQYLIANRHTH